MADRILAELAALERGEADLRRAYERLEKELDRLDGDLRTSLAAWSGEARAAYEQAHREWMLAARDMARQVDELHRYVARARRNFHTSLHANHGMWNPP
ncbi:WXG100 family type VII secretion target [Actinomadura opuntiae]|uniref:WXG100 family type VII secretion target n=1 Tax=Actinomadura sp. OS1-43 TaxID=604315 RepID=UPI00255ADCA8|nr:WXG100 family type VII secretion target [Actinomadura sp. OS1-43]MDL4815519.1 WXG100 family type VII secretion target [Actinomadura sp. OS1-43]